MSVEIILWSISTKVWNRAGIVLATPISAVRHVTECPTRPDILCSVDILESIWYRCSIMYFGYYMYEHETLFFLQLLLMQSQWLGMSFLVKQKLWVLASGYGLSNVDCRFKKTMTINNSINNWASSRENLSSGFPTEWDSNQSPQLQRLETS